MYKDDFGDSTYGIGWHVWATSIPSGDFNIFVEQKSTYTVPFPSEFMPWEESPTATSVLYTAQSLTEEQKVQARQNIGAQDLYNGVQTNKENILGNNGSIISNSSRGNSLTISNGVMEQKNSNQNTISLGDAKVVFSYDSDGSSSTKGNGTFAMYGKKGEEYFKFKATNGDVKVSGIATPTLSNDAVNKSYVDSQIANIKIPTASATALGGVKVGAGLAIADDGTLSMNIASAAVGQIIKVKAVDENGKPTEWEAADIPSAVTDEHINSLIDAKLGAIKNGS